MHAYFGLNVDTACPKLLHSPDMHEVVNLSLNRTEPSLNRNQKNLTAFLLSTLVASPVVVSSACGGARSVSPGPAVGFVCCQFCCSILRSILAFSPDAETRTPDLSSVGLQTRVEEYWQARIQGNTQRTLQYEHPEQREKLNEKTYRARTSRIDIRTFSIADPDSLQLPAEAQEARVPVRIQYQYVFPIPGAKPMLVPTTIHDRWKKQDGVWYHDLAARGGTGSKKTHCTRRETVGRGMEYTGNGPKRQKLMTVVLLDRLFQVRYQRGNLLQGGNERRWFRGPGEE